MAAVMLYANRCLGEGDLLALRGMGFGPLELEALGTLNLGDVQRAGALSAHCLEVRLDGALFRRVVDLLADMRKKEELQRSLIRADAPSDMMRALFGMASREYTQLRHVLDVESGVGRPADLDDDMENRLWSVLRGRLRADLERPLEPHEFLAVRDECGVSLRALWTYARRWAARLGPRS
ncbi:MAG: STY4526/YPO1902 family pathogenicity island replication protein [Gammaproteobacteria bacterium]|nr:STY4526/YPO1902 family pathogenicity island replication protein [Gammaproteobacteria bacterium]